MFVAGMKAAASGVLIGGIIGSFVSVLQGNGLMEGLVEGIINGFINGFTTGALFFSISEVIHAYTNTANTYCASDMKCFKQGTLVLTKEGNKPIEEIQVGDEVWAYDEETGQKELKKVKQLFRNTTKQWAQVEIESEEGVETITCTPGHKFYLPENQKKRDIGEHQEHESYYYLSEKWVRAIDLKTKDKVLLENGKYGIIKSIIVQQLEIPETTYNFEVEGYHTYYVGNDGILTHNTGNCGGRPGKLGGVEHRNAVQNIKDSLGKGNFGVEKYFSNKNVSGMVKSRYADVVQLNSNGEVIKIFQVGKVGASGMPVLRESVALADLALATGGNIPIIFVPYNVLLPPIIFP